MQILCRGLKEEVFPVEFTDHKIFIGRDKSNSISLTSEGVSRFHALLIEEGEELFLQDSYSTNGTLLNNRPVASRQKLANGDLIQIAACLIEVIFHPEQNMVVLDFAPAGRTENVSLKPDGISPASFEPEQTPVADGDGKQTMPAPEPTHSRSSSSGSGSEHSQLSPWRLAVHDKRIVLSFVFILCALCILFFFLGRRSAMNNGAEEKREVEVELNNSDPLLVTTDQDIVDPNDDVNSLREALLYAQNNGLNETITFEKDCVIRLKETLAVFYHVSIDGGKKDITIIGPETEPMFRVKDSSLTMKNMTLLSDRSGDDAGIMDISLQANAFSVRWIYDDVDFSIFTSGMVRLISVKDGGKAKKLWSVSGSTGNGLVLERGSHIHRLFATSSDIRLSVGSVLEEATLENGRIAIRGTLKNSIVYGKGQPANSFLYENGTCENITMKDGAFLMTGNGTVKGLDVGYSCRLIYEPGCTLNGTITIGGYATTTGDILAYPELGTNTDIIFDLTDSEDNSLPLDYYDGFIFRRLLTRRIKGLLGARSFTIHVSESMSPGTYLLAGDAEDFDAPVSLKIGDITYSDVLTVGKSFTKNGRVYSLTLTDYQIEEWIKRESAVTSQLQEHGKLVLTIE